MRPSAQPDHLIIPQFDSVSTGAQSIRSALKNRSFTSAITTFPTPPTPGSFLFIATLLTTVKASGLFLAGATVATTGDTAGATVDFQIGLQAAPATPLITLANAVAVGPRASVSNAAAGILVTNGVASILQFDSGSQVLATGETTNVFSWSDYLNPVINGTSETLITPGVQILITLALNTSAAVTFRGLSFWATEQPA